MFFISLFLLLVSTFLFTNFVSKKSKANLFFIYFLLIIFAQIVLSFEVLSLLNSISAKNFLFMNIIFCIISFALWKSQNIGIIKLPLKLEINTILNALKLDKSLFVLSIFFILFLLVKIIGIFVIPVSWGDALSYYFTRCLTWIQQGNINHFITPDVRELIMPVNMDFLYTWIFLFLKNERGTAIFSFVSYIGAVYVIYNFLGAFKYSIRHRLWTIFVFSSFSLVASLLETPCADIFIGTLILISIYLFYEFSKNNDKMALYFSTLSYALAVGTKTTALIVFPSLCILFFFLLFKYKKSKIIKNLFFSLLLFVFNFAIFSAYNYILNFIQFSHPISNDAHMLLNKFFGGLNGYIFNVLNYCFVFLDASGVENIEFYNNFITSFIQKIFGVLGLSYTDYLSPYYAEKFEFSSKISPLNGFLGILGLFAFLPSLFISMRNLIIHHRSNKRFLIDLLGVVFIFNILVFAMLMIFTNLNMRYLLTFVVISSPILVYSYLKSKINLYKLIVTFFVFYYLFYIPITTDIPYLSYILRDKTRREWKNILREEVLIRNYLEDKAQKNILIYISGKDTSRFDIEKLKLKGFNVDKLLLENIHMYDISKYDYIITNNYEMDSSLILAEENMLCSYFDAKKNSIEKTQTSKIVRATCKIPFDYFEQHGFVQVDDINPVITNYKFYRRKVSS